MRLILQPAPPVSVLGRGRHECLDRNSKQPALSITGHALQLPVGKDDSAVPIAQQDAVRDGVQQRCAG